MNCDTAFDLMTDPETAGSSALARHLESCPRCRQMQQTLAPALDFLSRDREDDLHREVPGTTRESRAEGRQSVVTMRGVTDRRTGGQQGLAAQCRNPAGVCMQRMASRVPFATAKPFSRLEYFLAAAVFANREPSTPSWCADRKPGARGARPMATISSARPPPSAGWLCLARPVTTPHRTL